LQPENYLTQGRDFFHFTRRREEVTLAAKRLSLSAIVASRNE